MKDIQLGIAPIGWTNDDMPDLGGDISFEKCVDEMAKAGYKGTEIGNKYPKDPYELKGELDKRGLRIVNAWFSTFILTNIMSENTANFRAMCEKLSILGASKIGVSEQSFSIQGQDLAVFKEKKVLTSSEWERLFKGLEDLGKISKEEYDIDLVYHHHMGTVVQTAKETMRLMDNTNEFVGLLFDTGHFAYDNEDYMGILNDYHQRIKHVHLKDVRYDVIDKVRSEDLSFLDGVRMGTFTVPGDGDLDFVPVINKLKEVNYNQWLLVEAEQDPAKAEPYKYAKKAYEYILSIIK